MPSNNIKKEHGILVVRSKPSHATVTVDGKTNITPVFFNLEIRDLSYDITIKKEGYKNYTQKIFIQNTEKIEIKALLKKII